MDDPTTKTETWNQQAQPATAAGASAQPQAPTAEAETKPQPQAAAPTLLDTLGYLRSLAVTIPLVYLSTVAWGSLSLFISLFDKTGHGQHWCSRWWARTLLFVSRASVTVRGLENVQPGKTYIFAANHQSYMDIPVLFGYLPGQFRIMAKSSLFKLPFLGWHLTTSGHMPIERDNPRRAARSLLAAARHIKEGTRVFIFPEGGRTIDGRLAEFKAGTFLLAIKAGVEVIPVTVNGTRGILKINSWHIRPGHVEVILHPPISTTGMHANSAEELCEHVKQVINSAYDEARAVAAR